MTDILLFVLTLDIQLLRGERGWNPLVVLTLPHFVSLPN